MIEFYIWCCFHFLGGGVMLLEAVLDQHLINFLLENNHLIHASRSSNFNNKESTGPSFGHSALEKNQPHDKS